MGKMIQFVTLLIFLDLFLIATGQICNSGNGCSLGSIIFNALINIENVTASTFFSDFIGDIKNLFFSGTGFTSLALGAGVLIGSFFIPGDIRFFIPISISLALLTSDLVFIAAYFISINAVLGTMIFVPIILIYILTIVEWLRGRD